VAVGRNLGCGLLQRLLVRQAEPIREPAHHVAALAERPTQHESVSIDAVDEGSPGNRDPMAFQHHSHRARRSDRGAEPAWAAGAGADVGERPVADGQKPGNLAKFRPSPRKCRAQRVKGAVPVGERRQVRSLDARQLQCFPVPSAAVDIEQPGAGCHRVTHRRRAKKLLVKVFAKRYPADGSPHRSGTRRAQPAQLRRPVAGVKEASRARVVGTLVEARA